MSDHADVIREALWSLEGVFPGDYRLAALDALVAERDEQRSLSHEHYEAYVSEVALRQAAETEVARLQIALSLHPNTQAFLKQTELREAAEARVTELEAAGRQWLSETGPGQHVNTAKGRYMMQRALYPAALAAPTKEGT